MEAALEHSLRLNRRLLERLDPERYPCISPHTGRSPIVTFEIRDSAVLGERLADARVAVALGGRRLRVSPALYNDEGDVDRLVEVLQRG